MTTSHTTCFPHVTDVSLGCLAEAIGGELRLAAMPPRDGDMTPIERIVTDVRHVQRGDVYWAIPGTPCPNGFDPASDCAYEALMRGASGVVASHRVEPFAGRWSIEVADPRVALWEFARWKRDRFCGNLIALCGDEGDTITAALVDCILRRRMTGTSPSGDAAANEDSRITTPLALLKIDAADEYALVPLTADSSEHAEALVRLTRPKIAIITATEQTATAKKALALLSPEGTAVIFGDDPGLCKLAVTSSATVRTFGRNGDCDYAASNVEYRGGVLRCDVDGVTLSVRIWGRHHLRSVLAAFAAARVLGFSSHEIAEALAAFVPPPELCEVTEAEGLTIIHQTLRGNKESLVALELLRETAARGRRFVLCGDDHEATSEARDQRRTFGGEAVCRGAADRLIAYGRDARDVVTAARDAGLPLSFAVACRELEDAANYVAEESRPGDVLLISSAPREAINRIIHRGEPRNATMRRAA